jgi:glycosyltransferase involved in cell wall biosynthesis
VCDITVLPSFFEGTPNVVLESMACAVPVVVTDVSDNPLVVPDCRVGYVVALGDDAAMADRICRLLLDETHRRDLGRAARAWVEQEFSIQRLATKTAAVFDAALAEKRRMRGLADGYAVRTGAS